MTSITRFEEGDLPGAALLLGFKSTVIVTHAFTAANGHIFCGECRLCKRARAGVHPEYLTYTEDNIDEARAITSILSRRRAEEKHRVILIIGGRSTQYQNALLKSLEEPGPGNHIVWFGQSIEQFLDTVRSRCEIHRAIRAIEEPFNKEDLASARDFLDLVRQRNILALGDLVSTWERAKPVTAALAHILVEESIQTGNLQPYYAAVAYHQTITRGRPSNNAYKFVVDAILEI